MIERPGDVTHKGTPLTVLGKKLTIGDQAPNFQAANSLFSPKMVNFADSAGKVRLINVVPSLNTSICDLQTRRFNQEIAQYGDKVAAYTVSVDLPLAQASWCAAAGVANLQMLSDYRDMAFGLAYGTDINELRIEQRSVFIVDAEGVIRYEEYVPEIDQHPDYEAALAALKKVVG